MKPPSKPYLEPFPEELKQRFEPIALLGRGGFGEVIRCLDKNLGREVAVKLLSSRLDSPDVKSRFRREAEITSELRHPHIVTIYDFGVLSNQVPYIIYELIAGKDLEQELLRRKYLSPDAIQSIGSKVAQALFIAHQKGIIHRDLKPGNILLRGPEDPVLVDFGIARIASAETQFTNEGILLGTPNFMAPELWAGHPPSEATDQFAWAATLASLSGTVSVYQSCETGKIFQFVNKGKTPALTPDTREYLGALAPILEKALSKDPAHRYGTMQDAARALSRIKVAPLPTRTNPLQSTTPKKEEDTLVVRNTQAGGVATRETRKAPPTPRPLLPLILMSLSAVFVLAFAAYTRLSSPPESTLPNPPQASSRPVVNPRMIPKSLKKASQAIRDCLPPDSLVVRKTPEGPQLKAAYDKLMALSWEPKWKRFLAESLAWIKTLSKDDLEDGKVQSDLLIEIIHPASRASAFFREYDNLLRLFLNKATLLLQITEKNYVAPDLPNWEDATVQARYLSTLNTTQSFLCELDELPQVETPIIAVLEVELARLYSLYWMIPENDQLQCLEKTNARTEKNFDSLLTPSLDAKTYKDLYPFGQELLFLMARTSDQHQLSFEVRQEVLVELQKRAELYPAPRKPNLALQWQSALLLEMVRTSILFPEVPQETITQTARRAFQRFQKMARSYPAFSLILLERLDKTANPTILKRPVPPKIAELVRQAKVFAQEIEKLGKPSKSP